MNALQEPLTLPRLRRLWAEVLQLEPDGIDDDSHFLQLGGDSLQLLRLLGRLRVDFGVCLPPHELTRFATPLRMWHCCRAVAAADAAAEAAAGAGAGRHVAEVALPATDAASPAVSSRVPVTPVQQGLWLAEQLAAPEQLYGVSVLLHLQGPLQHTALETAAREVFTRHPVLRACLVHDARLRSLQLDLSPAAAPLPADLVPLQDCGTAAWQVTAQAAALEPLDLARGPLCRLRLFRCTPTRHVLLLCCHHLISDGWSGGILLQQLAAAYAAALDRSTTVMPLPDFAFVRHCQRESGRMAGAGPVLAAWQQRLAGVDLAQRWLWQGRSAEPWPHRLTQYTATVPAALVTALHRVARRLHCSLFSGFLAATCAALQSCSGELRQPLLLPLARRQPDEEHSIGCFIDTLLLLADWSPGLPPAAALRAASAAFDSARREQLPLTTLAAQLRPRLLPDGNPWTSILFAYQSFPRNELHWPGLQHRLQALPPRAGQHALKLEVLPAEADWHLRIEYAGSLLEPAWIESLVASWLARLAVLASAD